jgi:Predicted periplasmic protein
MRIQRVFVRRLVAVIVLAAATVCLSGPAAAACRDLVVQSAGYTVCSFDPKTEEIRVYHSDPKGKPFSGFDALVRQLWEERHYLVFATNGGMYHDDLSPVGLFVEYGIERRPISTKAGWGNFHLLPNGVFSVKDGKAAITESRRYARRHVADDYATQSGPMLVIDGVLHPKFLPDSDSFKIRNGVGVDRGRQGPFRHLEHACALLRFRPPLPRYARLPERALSRRDDSSAYIPERWAGATGSFRSAPSSRVIGTVPQLSSSSGRTP